MVGREGLEPITWWSHNPLRYLFANVPMYVPVLHLGPMSRLEFETWSYGFHVQLVPPQVFIVSSAPHYAVY